MRFARMLALPAGAFLRAFQMRPDLLPGRYVLDVTAPGSPTPLTPQTIAITLRAPAEGVVSRVWTSNTAGGVPLSRFPTSTTIVFAQFQFAALPGRGHGLVATFYPPPGYATKPQPKLASPLVVTYVGTKNGVPLPAGAYSCVLRAGGTVVKRVAFRVG